MVPSNSLCVSYSMTVLALETVIVSASRTVGGGGQMESTAPSLKMRSRFVGAL